jgi:PUA domain protein
MFRKFSPAEDIQTKNAVKSSMHRSIKARLNTCYPVTKSIQMFSSGGTKKQNLSIIHHKCTERRNVFSSGSMAILFTSETQGTLAGSVNSNTVEPIYYPTLRLLHQYPDMLPSIYVDSGALSHLLNGANVMAPGIFKIQDTNHPIPKDLVVGDPVAIYCHGKEHALAIGRMLMSSNDLTPKTKGHAIEIIHSLGDSLWYFTPDVQDSPLEES